MAAVFTTFGIAENVVQLNPSLIIKAICVNLIRCNLSHKHINEPHRLISFTDQSEHSCNSEPVIDCPQLDGFQLEVAS